MDHNTIRIDTLPIVDNNNKLIIDVIRKWNFQYKIISMGINDDA